MQYKGLVPRVVVANWKRKDESAPENSCIVTVVHEQTPQVYIYGIICQILAASNTNIEVATV